MKPSTFEYHRPETAAEAVGLLGELGDDAKVLAGGQSLVPMLSLRLATFEHLVDITRLDELRGIERQNGSIRIGATTTEAEIEASAEIASAAPLLVRATPLIGHFQIRNRGTIGGSLAHADPAAEYPAVVLALDATFDLLGPTGARTVEAADFFTGLWETAIEDGELLTGVRVPVWSGRCGFAVEEVARRHGDFAIAGAAVAVELGPDDRVVRCGVGLIGVDSTPVRATTTESEIVGRARTELDVEQLGRYAAGELSSIPGDAHAPPDYRRRIAAVTLARALEAALSEAHGGA